MGFSDKHFTTTGTPNMPSGVLLPFAGSSAPTGYLLCYGQAVSRTDYADLFSAIGETYGAGDGSTTFNLPDLRGRIPAGKDNMGGSAASRLTSGGSGVDGATLGATGGTQTHTLTSAQMPTHSHNLSAYNSAIGSGSTSVVAMVNGTSFSTNFSDVSSFIQAANTGSGSAHNNTQPTIILNYIIKV